LIQGFTPGLRSFQTAASTPQAEAQIPVLPRLQTIILTKVYSNLPDMQCT